MQGNPDALRIHFCAVGPREVDKVCGPLLQLKADRVHLLRTAVNDAEAPYRDRVRDVLRPLNVEVREEDVQMRHPALVAFRVGAIVGLNPGMNYRFNLSTGPREATLGGYLASMFWEVQPYLSHLNEDAPPDDPEFDDRPYSHFTNVPPFRQAPPREDLLDALEWLLEKGGSARQGAMIEALVDKRIIRPRGERGRQELSAQAKQGQFRSIIDALARFGFVRPAPGVGRSRWEATDQAVVGLAMFRGRRIT